MKYINRRLTIEKISLQKIANKFGTPFYSYSYSKLKEKLIILKKTLDLFHHLSALQSNPTLMLI